MPKLASLAKDETGGDARVKAEIAIERILFGLEHETGCKVDRVDVDTRNFASYDCEIFFRERPSR